MKRILSILERTKGIEIAFKQAPKQKESLADGHGDCIHNQLPATRVKLYEFSTVRDNRIWNSLVVQIYRDIREDGEQ